MAFLSKDQIDYLFVDVKTGRVSIHTREQFEANVLGYECTGVVSDDGIKSFKSYDNFIAINLAD